MATALVTAMSFSFDANDVKMWKGGARLVYAKNAAAGDDTPYPAQAFPRYIEDVINLSTYALKTGHVDFGATNEDGISITRAFDTDEGVNIDQRDYAIAAGGLSNYTMALSGTSMDTSLDKMKLVWNLGDIGTITLLGADGGGQIAHVAQRSLEIGAPTIAPGRAMYVLQQHAVSGKVRLWAFRNARLSSAGDISMNSRNFSSNEFSFTILPDPSVTDGSDFGLLFELS